MSTELKQGSVTQGVRWDRKTGNGYYVREATLPVTDPIVFVFMEEEPIYHGKFRLIQENVGSNKDGDVLNLYNCPFCDKALVKCRPSDAKANRRLSCGCVTKDSFGNIIKHHHQAKTSLHNRWKAIKTRTNPNRSKAKDDRWYNGKGIRLCDEWQDFNNFYKWAMANGYCEGLEIDRIDGNGNYCPENCQWITHLENVRRKKACVNNPKIVQEIRNLSNFGNRPKEIIKILGVTANTVNGILNNRDWIGIDATVPRVNMAFIQTLRYYFRDNNVVLPKVRKFNKPIVIHEYMSNQGFMLKTIFPNQYIPDIHDYLRENYIDLIHDCSVIIVKSNIKSNITVSVDLFYKMP